MIHVERNYIARAHTRGSAHARTRGMRFNTFNTFNSFNRFSTKSCTTKLVKMTNIQQFNKF
nr:MAG TPA: hypothetical protein [Microviridae sp.]